MRKLIETEDHIDENAKGMNVDALRKSRKIRAEFLSKFGKVPTSILLHDRSEANLNTLDLSKEKRGGGYVHHFKQNKLAMRRSASYTPNIEKTGLSIQGRKNILSAFPQSVGRTMIEMYCPEDGIIYDPFAGHNSRMELSFKCKRHYIGVDCSKEFMADNRKIREILLKRAERALIPQETDIHLLERSSDNVPVASDYADFTLTSPPYWDIEYYGDEEEQLGNAKTYERFLELLSAHVVENFRVLKPGAFCCWFINDFRKKKKFYPYHVDLYKIFLDAGFEPFNIYIVDLGVAVNATFVQVIIKTKILPKQHEYILVFRKPEA